jgi:hypothetical protein
LDGDTDDRHDSEQGRQEPQDGDPRDPARAGAGPGELRPGDPAGATNLSATQGRWREDACVDLKAASVEYRDSAGLVFDFHSLRCETATLLAAAGVSLRIVQRIMRHSSEKLTNNYTRPRVSDIEAAVSMLPTLKPECDRPEVLAATGPDPAQNATADAT